MRNYLLFILSASFTLVSILLCQNATAQSTYWQQRVNYQITVDFEVKTHQYTGNEKIIYTNNSPDTLRKAYFHLYMNAFQPGSMMDQRSRNIIDPDRRVKSRIASLAPDEIGYLRVLSLKKDGSAIPFTEEGTILVVKFPSPILPGESAELEMEFEGQVPIQIRRNGRNSAEGIDYSMSQWYPKLAEYDKNGWHPNPYVAREFYGVWGDFDVRITIDPSYILAGSGYLQNPNEVGYGYEEEGKKVKVSKKPLTWHFKAFNVHDFMWAADRDYVHTKLQVPDGPMLHFFYLEGSATRDWKLLPEQLSKATTMASIYFGEYPYKEFHVIQGGDGGMEYPMSTLITGNRRLGSLVGTSVHELMHSWYQGVLGTDESLYPWMDEGFTEFASNIIVDQLFNSGKSYNPHIGQYSGYFRNVVSGNEQPMTLHSDHYQNNRAYSANAYSKGAVFLNQLGYVIGNQTLMIGMRRYFNEWKFKHPTPDDFIRIMEIVSDMELDWYLEQFIYSTNTIDYRIDSVFEEGGKTIVNLRKEGEMMMPIDLLIESKDGNATIYYIPLRIMRGEKTNEYQNTNWQVLADWTWTLPTYRIELDVPLEDIKSIVIDPSGRMADISPLNNEYLSGELRDK